jgi:hypothetical protein
VNAAASSTAAFGEVSSRRQPPGFCRQFWWCLTRLVLMRTREPMLVSKALVDADGMQLQGISVS